MKEASVVIASFSGEDALSACLRSLQPEVVEAETIVVGGFDPASLESLRRRHPWATFLAAPPPASVFALRALGVARASGRVVALLEDHCVVAPGWLAALLAAVDGGRDTAAERGRFAGGAVESGRASSIPAWALYLVEYGALMPPMGEGARGLLAVNAAYSRAALEACRAVWADGFHDNEVHDALRAAGHEPRLAGKATVTSHLRLSLGRAGGHLFAGGRRFGAYRRRRWAGGERLARVLATPAVPLAMLARIFGRVLARRPATLPRMLAALPHLVCLLCAWSAGELVGHLAPAREAVPE
jgi:glycosyl transferase family 2